MKFISKKDLGRRIDDLEIASSKLNYMFQKLQELEEKNKNLELVIKKQSEEIEILNAKVRDMPIHVMLSEDDEQTKALIKKQEKEAKEQLEALNNLYQQNQY